MSEYKSIMTLRECMEAEEQVPAEDRARVLLKAAYDLLLKQENSNVVLNLLTEHAHYDDADCDGYCLMSDIETELDL